MGILEKLKSYFQSEHTIVKVMEDQVNEAFSASYDAISTITRCVDLLVNTSAQVNFVVVEDIGSFDIPSKHTQFEKLLDQPTLEFGKFDFFRNCYRDQIFSGNTFLYNIGTELQLLNHVTYDPKPTVNKKILDSERLIHVRLLPEVDTRYGNPYISRIDKELNLIAKMLSFSTNYFKNGGLPGCVLESEHPLSPKQKERMQEEFVNMFSISRGLNSKPFIADNNVKLKEIQHSMKDLQFNQGIDAITTRICAALGVPEVILNSGNNANILPNYKMFVYTSIAPFVLNMASDLTRHLHTFYKNTSKLKVIPDFSSLPLLADDELKRSNSIKTLVTTGILTVNEGRLELKRQKSSNPICDEHLIPQNITGANFEPSPGKPTDEE